MAVGLVLIGHLDGFHGAPIGRLTVLRLERAVLLEYRLARTFLSEYRLTRVSNPDPSPHGILSDGTPHTKVACQKTETYFRFHFTHV